MTLFTKIQNKLPKILRAIFGDQKIIDSLEKQINQSVKIEFYKTDLGDYYLPSSIASDIIINHMKQGQIFESEIVEIAKNYIYRGSTVLDVGSNFGQMTIIFSKLVGEGGKVLSFEADEFIHSILTRNTIANNCHNVTVICKAVYDKDEDVMFYPVPDFQRFKAYGSYGLNPSAKQGRKV